jgi:uncharacterized membrane protein YvbJ
MAYCSKCGNAMPDEYVFCSKCGYKLKQDGQNDDRVSYDETSATLENKHIYKLSRKFSPKYLIVLGTVFIIGIAVIGYLNYFTLEAKAKNIVNKYLEASKNGESTYAYKKSNVDDFINVLDYKFINVKDKKQKPKILTIDYDLWEEFYKDQYSTFTEFADSMIALYKTNANSEVLKKGPFTVEIKTGELYDELTLLYDLEVTNKLGQKIYKKVYFIVNNDNAEDKFEITSILYD